jgi:hypothetical protein
MAAGLSTVLILLWIGASDPAVAAPSSGAERRVLDDRWGISLGAYLTEVKTDASVGSSSGVGSLIRAEDQLGLDDDQSVVRMDGIFRLGKRQAIGLGLWTLNRDGQASIDEQIEFDGNVFDVGAELRSQFDTGWVRVDWRYNLLRTERGEAGLSAGLSVYRFDISLEGEATVSDGMGGTTLDGIKAEDDLLAPVPTVGFFLTYALRPKLFLKVKADLLDLDVGDYEGKLTDATVLVEWYFSRHAGFGLGINRSDIEVRFTGDDPFRVSLNQSGLLGYFAFAF